ncbi:Phage P2 GpU [Humidesulfovibrio mexicanus]|uniref:Phage P2 GpU n=1 Tax=Humidesulfovibrio mexicanus TaxID=147047 RepID=A0A239C7Y7_9BACT|nr:phage tail protein [Humidesulfovibrio mexicanus]SNS16220.1 Phage P2 GpU [Humidesulfovibrio mexicanus]
MATVDAATRSALQASLLASMFKGAPPNPATISPLVEMAAVAHGSTLSESGLAPWARMLELELGALTGKVDRTMGRVGLDAESRDLALLAVSGVMTMRGQGVGPDSWKLWLDQDASAKIADAVVGGALAKLPAASILSDAKDLLQTFKDATAVQTPGIGWPLPIPEEIEETSALPMRAGTGSFGPVSFEVSTERVKTWSDLSREHKGRYAAHEVLGAMPRLEFLAPEITPTTFAVRLDAGLGASPAADLDTLADLCRTGRVERLVLGGRNLGPHVLESVKETWRRLGPGGFLLVAEAELTLKEYA